MTITQLFPRDGGLNVITRLRQRVDIVRASLWRAPTSQADCERVHQLAIAAEDALFELALGLPIDSFEETERRAHAASSAVELLERSVLRCADVASSPPPSSAATPVVSLSPLRPDDPLPAGVVKTDGLRVVHFVDETTTVVDINNPFFQVSRSGVTLPRFGGPASFTSFHPWANAPASGGPPGAGAGPTFGGLPLEALPLLVEGGRAIGKLLFNRDRDRPRFARLEVTRLEMDAARIELLVATQPARYTESGGLIYDVIFSAPVVLPSSVGAGKPYSYHFLIGSPVPGPRPDAYDDDDGEEDELDPDPSEEKDEETEPPAPRPPEPPPPEADKRHAPPRGPNVAEKN